MTTTLDSLRFLAGEWIGEGTGAAGEGQGGFFFTYDLQEKVLIRKNFAEYPATAERPAYRHDDLMVIYHEADQSLRAIYFDNEGHVINYTVAVAEDQSALIFLGDINPRAPRFRFTYEIKDDDHLGLKFEIAPPGQPGAFNPYIVAKAHRG